MKLGKSSLNDIAKIKPDSVKRRRISSYDISGGNHDWIDIEPGEKVVIAEVNDPGSITHIWCTILCKSRYYLRNIILRMYWDNEQDDSPSVEAPIGDFFGLGHAKHKNYVSLPLQMSPQWGKGFNCWWPMPFSKGFKITVENDNSKTMRFFFYIDYEIFQEGFENEKDYGRFHVLWHRENPTIPKKKDSNTGKKFTKIKPKNYAYSGDNIEDPRSQNYKILEAQGKGHFVGCHLDIDNITFLPWYINWPGEGDDMIYIDEDIDKNIPTLHGTGTEDYVNQSWAQRQKYHAPYHGTIKAGGINWWGKISYYRYHIEDPIYFNKKILVTIEHGHDNHRRDDWSSTAYWYQVEPHDQALFPNLLDKKGRKPRFHYAHTARRIFCIGLLLTIAYFWIFL
ncbi:MAG: DUF2961 domain-containing protein [Promethearchaeota archaeon]|nr:MAG: DUF2961 domain-containing protein [Candidatus Lokiarchaeota archaeon]